MNHLLRALVILAAAACPALADFNQDLANAQASMFAAVKETRPARTAGCVIQSDRPIAAVNQDQKVPIALKMPVEIRQLAPNRIEIRVAGQPAGSGPFAPSPYAAKIAGIMISEADTPGYWLVGVIATETSSGQRLISAWQATLKNGAPSAEIEIDLSRTGSRSLNVRAPSKQGEVPVEVTCFASLPSAAAK